MLNAERGRAPQTQAVGAALPKRAARQRPAPPLYVLTRDSLGGAEGLSCHSHRTLPCFDPLGCKSSVPAPSPPPQCWTAPQPPRTLQLPRCPVRDGPVWVGESVAAKAMAASGSQRGPHLPHIQWPTVSHRLSRLSTWTHFPGHCPLSRAFASFAHPGGAQGPLSPRGGAPRGTTLPPSPAMLEPETLL